MSELSNILNIPILQAIGLLLLVALAERLGVPIISIIKSLLKINGKENGNGYQKQIDELHEHARTSNEEVGKIQTDIAQIKSDLSYLRGRLESFFDKQ